MGKLTKIEKRKYFKIPLIHALSIANICPFQFHLRLPTQLIADVKLIYLKFIRNLIKLRVDFQSQVTKYLRKILATN